MVVRAHDSAGAINRRSASHGSYFLTRSSTANLTCKVILTNLEKMMRKVLKWKLFTLCLLSCVPTAAGEYDPLSESASVEGQTTELLVKDESRQREIPLKVYLPEVADSSPVVLFSHGLGGMRDGCAYLGKHWSARGYVVVFLQHPGSDDSVWKDAPLPKRMAAMQQAASPQNFLLRVRDVPAVLDQLEKWNKDSQHVVAGRLDIQRVGMSGHSFGAVTTQAVSGQSYSPLGPKFTDARIKAAIALSPSSPRSGDPKRAFGRVTIPWLLMTGTKDTSPIGGQTISRECPCIQACLAGSTNTSWCFTTQSIQRSLIGAAGRQRTTQPKSSPCDTRSLDSLLGRAFAE